MIKKAILVLFVAVVVAAYFNPQHAVQISLKVVFTCLNTANKYLGSEHDPVTSIEYDTANKLLNRIISIKYNVTEDRKYGNRAFVPLRSGVSMSEVQIPRDDKDSTNISAIWLTPTHVDPKLNDKVLLHFHGGGMVLGTALGESSVYAEIVHQTNIKMLSVDYRLLPEHTMQEAVYDGVIAFKYLTNTLKYDPKNIVAVGCSAGGGMILYSTLELIRMGEKTPKAIVTLSPGPGLEVALNKTFDQFASSDLPKNATTLLSKEMATYFRKIFRENPQNPEYIRQLFAYVPKLPPTYLLVGEHEVTRDQVLGFGEIVKKSGVDVEIHLKPRMFHCYIMGCIFDIPESFQLISELSSWILHQLS